MNFGIIGLGKISRKFASEFEFIQGSKIIIAGSREVEKAKIFCSEYSIAESGTYEDVINHIDVEAIYIGTPHHAHYEIAKAALSAGKHVLCEKSITTDANQFRDLSRIAKENNLFLMDAMWTYFLPAMTVAKQWADDGKIGKVRYVSIDFSFPAVLDLEGRLYNPNLAGGALLDIGVYLLYNSFLFLGSDYHSFKCAGELSSTKVDESCSIQFDYGNAKSNLYCSIAHRTLSSALIYGDLGSIEVPLFWKTTTSKLFDNDCNLTQEFTDNRKSHGFEFEIKHFIHCIENNLAESPILPHALTLKVMETMDAIRKELGVIYPFDHIV
jgi:predicted dehydrogenase